MRMRLTRLKISDPTGSKRSHVPSTLNLVRFPHSLAVTLHSFTFYVAHPTRSILLPNFYFSKRVRSIAWLGGVPWLATISLHLVTKLHRAALVGFNLHQMENDVSVELLEERYPIANQDRQDRIANVVS